MTPLVKLSPTIYAKCEFMNPTGSHKYRSLSPWINALTQKGITDFVISSSGNAAIAAARVSIDTAQIKSLTIFLPETISESKKFRLQEILEDDHERKVKIIKSPSAKSAAIAFAKEKQVYNLRGSTDDLAKIGYQDLSKEIIGDLPDCDALFFPTSSGTSLCGVYDGYTRHGNKIPAFFAMQTESCHPLLEGNARGTTKSLADAICDRVAHRKKEIKAILDNTGGNALVISEKLIKEATEKLHALDIPTSYEGGLAYAGALEVQNRGMRYNKGVVILTGIK